MSDIKSVDLRELEAWINRNFPAGTYGRSAAMRVLAYLRGR